MKEEATENANIFFRRIAELMVKIRSRMEEQFGVTAGPKEVLGKKSGY